jgi:AcrR family transcriptional regulator
VGRPREHNERTAGLLLDAAEQAIQDGGIDAVSVRGVADQVGTTTRAVYSLFGSKDGLLVALGARAFEMLSSAGNAMPETDDPAGDLVETGVAMFRRFVIDHPILFRVGFRYGLVPPELAARFETARLDAWAGLVAKVARLGLAGLLGGRSVAASASHFNAICEGLAEMELRGSLPLGQEEHMWRDALTALVAGLAIPADTERRFTDAGRRVIRP